MTVPNIIGFNMVGSNDIDPEKPLLEQYRLGVREPVFDKRAIFDVSFDMAYTEGCHSWGAGFEHMKQRYGYKTSNKHKIALLHYKHIGSRLLESSKANLSRFSEDDIKITEDGRYVGPGSHYKFYVDKSFKESPLVRSAVEVLDKEYNVLFDNFGDPINKGSKLVSSDHRLDENSLNFLADLAFKLERLDSTAHERLINMINSSGHPKEVITKILSKH